MDPIDFRLIVGAYATDFFIERTKAAQLEAEKAELQKRLDLMIAQRAREEAAKQSLADIKGGSND